MITDWIARPEALLLFLLFPYFLLLVLRGSLARLSPEQRRWTLLTRAALLALLTLALAGVRIPWHSRDVSVVFAFDRSSSITQEAAQAGKEYLATAMKHRASGDDATSLGFARDVIALPLSTAASEGEEWPRQIETDATDIGKALTFASAVGSAEKVKRVVLFSDGYDTEGRALEAARALLSQGKDARAGEREIELFVVPLKNPHRPEVLVESFSLPQELHQGEPFNATATLHSNVQTPTTVKLYANGFVVAEQQVKASAGKTAVTFRNLQPGKESATYEVEILPQEDTLLENNRSQASALQRGEPRILAIDPTPSRLDPLKQALAQEKIALTVRPLEGLPTTLEELQTFDAFFLSDVNAMHLSRAQMQLYTRWVKEFGGGFAMLGGENSYGVGGYFRTPIETMLPVRTEHDDRTDSPSVAMVIILDSSGSMSATASGQTKMSLANQGAALALDVLQSRDYLGVMAVDTRVHQIAPLARHTNKSDVAQDILRVTAGGGGIYVYTSLLEAAAQLREVNARVKHVILFSDAADAEEKAAGEMADGSQIPGTALDLVNTMAAARITTSVVALGQESDKDVAFLKDLAANGGGRFYLTSDALTLPQIFTTETMRVAQSSVVEDAVLALPLRKGALTAGINWEEAPLLLGYNMTKLKPTADLLLATEKRDPLLATWRYGLGHVAAFTSDAKSRWAAEWLDWGGYGKFWAQLARSLVRRNGAAGDLQVGIRRDGQALEVTIDAIAADGQFRNQLPLSIGSLLQDRPAEMVQARQIAPGRYQARVPLGNEGTTWLAIRSGETEGSTVLSYTPSYPAEYLHNDTNEEALKQIAEVAQGQFAPPPEAIFAPPAKGRKRFADLSPLFLALALLIVPLDIWLRRRAV